jgi:hypothetical protein
MANLTVAVDAEILRRAQARAVEEGTSVESLVRDVLGAYGTGGPTWEEAAETVLRLSAAVGSGRGALKWTRDQLHER